jgi:hypothetical protein
LDAISRSLLKYLVRPRPGTLENPSRSLELGSGEELVPSKPRPCLAPCVDVIMQGESNTVQEGASPCFIHMIQAAVKEAFMEVDKEAPDGWQAWRMSNEMVHGDTIEPSTSNFYLATNTDFFCVNPDVNINQIDDTPPPNCAGWDSSTFSA